MMRSRTVCNVLATAALVLLAGCHAMGEPGPKGSNLRIHYLEIVCPDVTKQCATLERLHGLSFGPPVADLGEARVAKAADGSLIGVRAPLAAHEQPVTRTYLEVADIARAIKEAEAAGAEVAYPPTKQGDTGTWAIYFLDGVQIGLWQR
jgi:predicted enzyme related to lactoylglutathione lyase